MTGSQKKDKVIDNCLIIYNLVDAQKSSVFPV